MFYQRASTAPSQGEEREEDDETEEKEKGRGSIVGERENEMRHKSQL